LTEAGSIGTIYNPNHMNTCLRLVIVPILILIGILAGLSTLLRPQLTPTGAPEPEFSAERAMIHVSAISAAPHPPGSEEIKRVRSYIIDQLEGMGLAPHIQNSETAASFGSYVVASSIQNIIAKIPGSNSGKAILLDAHYDTRAMTPGAADNSSAVAVLLETARAVLSGPALENDLIFLFTDNEEYGGGLGAAAFNESHPWKDEVGLVLNFEGLGSSGPSMVFETGPDSGRLVRAFEKTAVRPVGQSWFNEVYKLTPINTDLKWFSKSGIPGINFGFWAKGTSYHSALDTPQNLDARSLQHHGSYALSMVRHLGNQEPAAANSPSGDRVYFSLFNSVFVHYPAAWTLPLSILAGILLILVVVSGIRRRLISITGSLKGLGAFVLSTVVSSGLATGIWMAAARLHGAYRAMFTFRGMFYNGYFYLVAFMFLALAVASAVLVLFRRRTKTMDLFTGALLFFWLLTLMTALFLPGFSYLFTWPLLGCLLGIGWIFIRKENRKSPVPPELVLTLGALPGLVLFAPALYIMYHFALSPMIGVLPFMFALLLGLLIPQMDLLTRTRRWALPAAAAAICAVFLITGSFTARFSPDRPRPNAAAYLLDTDADEAVWFSAGTEEDSWTRQFFSSAPEAGTMGKLFPMPKRSRFPVMYSEAAAVPLAAPQALVLDDRISDNGRTLVLKLHSPRRAPILMLDVQPGEAVRAAVLNGKRIENTEPAGGLWSLTYYAPPPEGFEITLELDPVMAVTLQEIDQTWYLLPEVLATLETDYRERPKAMMRMPNFDYGTVAVRTFIP
jgi:hypothetical protein